MYWCKRRAFLVIILVSCTMVLMIEWVTVHHHHKAQHNVRLDTLIIERDVESSNFHLDRQSSSVKQSLKLHLRNLYDEEISKNGSLSLNLSPGKLDDYEGIEEDVEYDNFDSGDDLDEDDQDLLILKDLSNTPKTLNICKPTCKSLIHGNGMEIVKSLVFSGTYPYVSKMDYVSETENCGDFLRNRGYILGNVEEETEFPIAYSIVMYKDVEQVERLLRAIYRPSNHYCIHVDMKAKDHVQREIKRIVRCFPNVFLSSSQVHVRWGSFSVLETEFVCMRDLLKRPGWKYFINLTGQEFPLKTNLEIVQILKIMNGTNSIDANTQQRWKARRWQRAWPPPHDIQPYKGNVHAVVTRDFVTYVLNNPKIKDFVDWLKKTVVPDETFFSTLDNNPHLHVPGSSIGRISTDYVYKPYIARFKNWGPNWGERSFDWPCRGKRVRNICIFGVGDLPLLTSRRELFANKFHMAFQPQTLDCIEEWHRNRTLDEYRGTYKMNYDFYRNMPQLHPNFNNSELEQI